ncbi:hypothetical protein [Streptomyces buecherae]|uniref:hypothetical protein n=1 Tax=Streptomyces buecherae TaxID=2763006 RepID=UPI001C256B9A|nr:hypothetical protein [Streptomyces buecherae]
MAATPDTTTLADRTTSASPAASGATPYTDPKADPYARPSRTNPSPTASRTPLPTAHR